MRSVSKPVPILGFLLAIGGAMFGQWPLVILGFIVFLGAVAFDVARTAQQNLNEDPAEGLSPESRTMLRPLRKLREELDELVDQHKDSSTVAFLGTEALHEADRIIRQSAEALSVRDKIKKAAFGRYDAERSAAKLEERIQQASTDEERAALLNAKNARETEKAHYDDLEAHLKGIETSLRQAEAALGEIKARLASGASGEKAASLENGELRDTLARLKALSVSHDEVQELMGR